MYTISTFGAQTFTTNSKLKLARSQVVQSSSLGKQMLLYRMVLKDQNNKIHSTPFFYYIFIVSNKTKLQQTNL